MWSSRFATTVESSNTNTNTNTPTHHPPQTATNGRWLIGCARKEGRKATTKPQSQRTNERANERTNERTNARQKKVNRRTPLTQLVGVKAEIAIAISDLAISIRDFDFGGLSVPSFPPTHSQSLTSTAAVPGRQRVPTLRTHAHKQTLRTLARAAPAAGALVRHAVISLSRILRLFSVLCSSEMGIPRCGYICAGVALSVASECLAVCPTPPTH